MKVYREKNNIKKKVFTTANRRIIKVKQRFGLAGIAFITPIISQPIGAFFKLKHPIDFAAPDGEPVSILIFLLVPEKATQQHLEILSSIAQLLSDPAARESLNSENDPNKVFQLLQNWGKTA